MRDGRGPLAAALAVILSAGPAFAAKATKVDVQVRAVQTQLTRPTTRPAVEENRRPALLAAQFRAVTAARIERLTDQAIRVLLRLIAATPGSDPEKPGLLFRLAELYRERKTQLEFRARALDEQIFRASSAAEKARLRVTQQGYQRQEHAWLLEAMRVYLQIAETPGFAAFRRMDEVLFNVADMLGQAKRRDKARHFFSLLIRNHPQSRYIPDAYLSFAEHYFHEGKIDEALRLYQQVSRYPGSPVAGYARYMEGWCWLNLKQPRRALEVFVSVVKDASASAPRTKILLVREARKDVVRAYSHVGVPELAWPFFQRIGGRHAAKMLEQLASLYYDQGKFAPSILVHHKLMSIDPQSERLCAWQHTVVKSTISAKDKHEQAKEALRLAAVFKEAARAPAWPGRRRAGCREAAAGVLRELATTWHREAQTTRNPATYALAEHLYRQYLQSFPGERDRTTMSYYHAELLYALERWEEAGEAYTRVVQLRPEKKLAIDAAYAAVLAWKNARGADDSADEPRRASGPRAATTSNAGQREAARDFAPRPLTHRDRKLVDACRTYLGLAPRSPEAPAVVYQIARVYYERNHFKEATDPFAQIVLRHPEHELAPYAANLLLDSLNILGRLDEVDRWATRMLAEPRLTRQRPDLRGDLGRVRADVQIKIADQLRKDGRYAECGDRYTRLANASPDDPRWPKLLESAAVCYEAAKLIGKAIHARNALVVGKPDSPQAKRALYLVGANYHALAWYNRAADYYERFARQFPGEKEAPAALQNAIVFRLGRGEHERALEDARFFERTFGARLASRTAAVHFSLGAVHEHRQDRSALIRHYQEYLRRWGTRGGSDLRVRAEVKLGEAHWEQSCPVPTVNGACMRVERVEAKRRVGRARRAERRTQCGPEDKLKITVVRRDAAAARAAQASFARALALFRQSGAPRRAPGESEAEHDRRRVELRQAAASALFHQAEDAFARFLELEFPRDLDFSRGDRARLARSQRTFKRYLEEKGRRLEGARALYGEAIKLKSPGWAIAGAARVGQLFQSFAGALYTAPIPRPPVPAQLASRQDREAFVEAFTDAYCAELEKEAGKLEAKAIAALDTCLRESTRLSWYSDWSQLCEAELTQINPTAYPLAAEIRAEPRHAVVRVARARLVAEPR